jgi:hypothetical protein
LMHSRYDCSLHLCQDRRSHGSPHYQPIPSSSGLIWNSSSIIIFFWHQWDEDHWSNQTQAKERWNSSWIRSEIQRVRNKCYSLNLGDKQLAELAFQGLLPTLREKYASHDLKASTNWSVGWVKKQQSPMSLEETFSRRYHMWTTLTQKTKTVW